MSKDVKGEEAAAAGGGPHEEEEVGGSEQVRVVVTLVILLTCRQVFSSCQVERPHFPGGTCQPGYIRGVPVEKYLEVSGTVASTVLTTLHN